MTDIITTTIDDDGIATLTWDMAGRSMNVMSDASIRAYGEATQAAIENDAVKGIIIASAKRDFVAGADLEMMQNLSGVEETFEHLYAMQKG